MGTVDPMDLAEWGLPAILAWVAWRDPERVRHHLDACRGADTSLPRPATVDGLQLWARLTEGGYGPNAPAELETALAVVWAKAQSGEIGFTAEDVNSGTVDTIPAAAWRFLHSDTDGTADLLAHRPGRSGGKVHQTIAWRAPAARRIDVLGIWPAEPSNGVIERSNVNEAGEKVKRGRPKEINWDDAEKYLLSVLEDRGIPDPRVERIYRKAELIKILAECFQQEYFYEPSQSSLKTFVNKSIDRFRRSRAESQ